MGAASSPAGSGRSLAVVLILAAAVRLALFFTPQLRFVPLLQQHRPELGTPINSFKVVKEALHLQKLYKGAPGQLPKPYASGTLHFPPLLLGFLEPVVRFLSSYSTDDADALHQSTAVVWTVADTLSGLLLASIFTRKQRYTKRIHHHSADQAQLDTAILAGSLFASPSGVAAAYLFNPFTLATCLARSTPTLNNAMLLVAVDAALAASSLRLSVALASAILISLYPLLLAPALILLCATMAISPVAGRRKAPQKPSFSIKSIIATTFLLAGALAAGVYTSYIVAQNDWRFVPHGYGTILLLEDLTPNVGLWWYFFIEIFDHFRDFFLLTFNVHVASYTFPLTIKYAGDPLFAVTVLVGLTTMLKSYPTLGDTALFLALVSLHREVSPYLRHTLLTALLFGLATCMMPALHHLWLVAGSGNANFFYASTLIWAFALGSLVLDLMWAWGRHSWEVHRPKLRVPKDVQAALPEGQTVVRSVVQS